MKIVASHHGVDQECSYLIVENLHSGRWAHQSVIVAPGVLGEIEKAAAKRLYESLVAREIVALDCHKGNMFFFRNADCAVAAGILDHDYIARIEEIPTLPPHTLERMFTQGGPVGSPAWLAVQRAVKGHSVSAKEFMDAFYQAKIAGEQPSSASEVIVETQQTMPSAGDGHKKLSALKSL